MSLIIWPGTVDENISLPSKKQSKLNAEYALDGLLNSNDIIYAMGSIARPNIVNRIIKVPSKFQLRKVKVYLLLLTTI